MFAQQQNLPMTHFSERIPVIKQHVAIFPTTPNLEIHILSYTGLNVIQAGHMAGQLTPFPQIF